jgi:hypothetical protein
MITVTCPHCQKEYRISASSTIPKEQTLKVTIISTASCFDAEMIGKFLINQSKVLKEIARSHNQKVNVFLKDIKYSETKIIFEIFIAKVEAH